MKRDASHELDVKMNHIPEQHIIDHFDLSSAKATSSVFYSGIGFWKNIIEILVTKIRKFFVDFVESGLSFVDIFASLDAGRKIGEFVAKSIESLLNMSCCSLDRFVIHRF